MRRRHSVAHPFHDNSHKDATHEDKIIETRQKRLFVNDQRFDIHREACLYNSQYIFTKCFQRNKCSVAYTTIQRSWTIISYYYTTISVFALDYRLDNCRVIVWRKMRRLQHTIQYLERRYNRICWRFISQFFFLLNKNNILHSTKVHWKEALKCCYSNPWWVE